MMWCGLVPIRGGGGKIGHLTRYQINESLSCAAAAAAFACGFSLSLSLFEEEEGNVASREKEVLNGIEENN